MLMVKRLEHNITHTSQYLLIFILHHGHKTNKPHALPERYQLIFKIRIKLLKRLMFELHIYVFSFSVCGFFWNNISFTALFTVYYCHSSVIFHFWSMCFLGFSKIRHDI